jgi:histidyl-tRNA synthetase
MNQNTPQTLKGFRDFLPETMVVRNYVKKVLIEVFESFGFQPLETPTLEYASTLMGKYGDEADKLVYSFEDQGKRKVGLRYDLTVPQSKVLTIYQNEISLPFFAYQIQPVWRADKPQKGRYREILQSEANIFGSSSPLADAQIINLIFSTLSKFNFKKFKININSRTVLLNILKESNIEKSSYKTVLGSLDKMDKIYQDGVTKELISKGVKEDQIAMLFNYIKKAQPDEFLKQVFDEVSKLNVPSEYIQFNPTLVRGLDYYTGPIFEAIVEEPKIGSLVGGGRFDNLINSLGGPNIPATGLAFGFDRIVDSIVELNLLPNLSKTTTKVLVSVFSPELLSESIKLTNLLRTNNLNTLLYPTADKLGKQFKYADSLGIPFVAIIGPDEAKNNQITLKNMSTCEQKTVPQSEIMAQFV